MSKLPVPIPVLRNYHHTSLLKNPALAAKVMERLKYDTYYKEDLKILDVYPSNLIFSSTLHNYLSPSQHLLMECRPDYAKYIQSYLPTLAQQHTFQNLTLDPFQWQSYLEITEKERLLEPGFETRDHIHSNFLFTGSCGSEGLLMQWMACMGNQNWIHRFGNVRMLLWVPQQSALKIMAPVDTRERNKCSIVREAFSDTRIVAIPNNSLLKSFNDNLIGESIVFDEDDFTLKQYPMALLEFNPKDNDIDDMFAWDFVTKNMMILKTKPVSEGVKNLGPGAHAYFEKVLSKNLWKTKSNNLTPKDFEVILNAFLAWPFRTDTVIDSLSDPRHL